MVTGALLVRPDCVVSEAMFIVLSDDVCSTLSILYKK